MSTQDSSQTSKNQKLLEILQELDLKIVTGQDTIETPFSETRFNNGLSTNIALFGLGGVGSHILQHLAGVNCRLYCFDNGAVEFRNIFTQDYFFEQIGMEKVSAAKINFLRRNGFEKDLHVNSHSVLSYNYQYLGNNLFSSTEEASKVIFISALDNMEGRKHILHAFKECTVENKLFIDCRMGLQSLVILTAKNNEEADSYLENYINDSSEVQDTLCTQRATRFMGGLIAGFVINMIANFIDGSEFVPSKLIYENNLMIYATFYEP